jgi:hypothetical protein
VEIDRMVLVGVEERPKARISGLFVAFIHRGFTILIDCLLGVAEGHVGGPLHRCMPLKHHTVIIPLIAGVRGVVTWARRRPMNHWHLAGATPLGGPSHILVVLGPFLTTRIHPEIKDME